MAKEACTADTQRRRRAGFNRRYNLFGVPRVQALILFCALVLSWGRFARAEDHPTGNPPAEGSDSSEKRPSTEGPAQSPASAPAKGAPGANGAEDSAAFAPTGKRPTDAEGPDGHEASEAEAAGPSTSREAVLSDEVPNDADSKGAPHPHDAAGTHHGANAHTREEKGDGPQEEEEGSDGDSPDDEKEEEEESNFIFRYLESIFGMPEDPSEPRFIAYPVIAFAPETSWEFGVSALVIYYANNDADNRLSEVNAYGFATLEGQLGLIVDHALYTDQDQWFILGEGKFQSFPLQYYGIGPDTPAEPRAKVDETALLIRERLLYRLIESLYIGPEVSFDYIGSVRFNWGEGVVPNPPNGADGSLNLSLGFGVVFDNRHNVLNVRDGLFAELAFLHSNDLWGSDFEFTVVESDTRYFIPINERDTLAIQLFGRFSFGDIPFNELSTLGGESLMRGYYLGRFRDRHFVGAQIEYRFLPLPFFTDPFWRRFGASLFLATGTVFPGPDLPPVSDFVLAGGAGLRFLLFPDKDVYTRLDVAFTEESPTFYLLIGEAF